MNGENVCISGLGVQGTKMITISVSVIVFQLLYITIHLFSTEDIQITTFNDKCEMDGVFLTEIKYDDAT